MKRYILVVCVALIAACTPKKSATLISEVDFGGQLNGKDVNLYTLKNANGIVIQITNYGGRVVSLWTPDRNGNMEDIVLGYETLDGYLSSNEIYFGATIGRVGNRIANGKFSLDSTEYSVIQNNGENHLHGGTRGFHNVVWNVDSFENNKLTISYVSPDMEEGFPGVLTTRVSYELTEKDELKIDYKATTDKATPVNMTHHSFFNLHGAGNASINNHELFINADYFTPVDAGLIPTGDIASVKGTPFDFNTPTAIGKRVEDENEQLKFGLGYDHNWVLNKNNKGLTFAAKITEPIAGRGIEVYTNEPGMQLYGGNFFNGSDTGKYGKTYEYRQAFCLETQHFPDAPNQPGFPTVILEPEDEYTSVCVYRFFTAEK